MAQANGSVKAALSYLDSHLSSFQDQLVALSRIPGVSAEPAPNEHLRRSAEATELATSRPTRSCRRKAAVFGRPMSGPAMASTSSIV